MINSEQVIAIHTLLIHKFGGSHGIRDKNALSSAVARPYTTFDNKELYPTEIEKAAAIIESLVKNHPFIDGNKRIGYVMMRMILLESGKDVDASLNEKYEFVISISKGQMEFEQIVSRIKSRFTA
jgi:death-on-curing protein